MILLPCCLPYLFTCCRVLVLRWVGCSFGSQARWMQNPILLCLLWLRTREQLQSFTKFQLRNAQSHAWVETAEPTGTQVGWNQEQARAVPGRADSTTRSVDEDRHCEGPGPVCGKVSAWPLQVLG